MNDIKMDFPVYPAEKSTTDPFLHTRYLCKPYIPTEAEEQKTLFNWADMQIYNHPELELLHHVPNGGSRNSAEAANLKKQGVKPGVPDICLPVPRGKYHGLYIELKRVEGGKLSENQKKWLKALAQQGYKSLCCEGWKEASEEILA